MLPSRNEGLNVSGRKNGTHIQDTDPGAPCSLGLSSNLEMPSESVSFFLNQHVSPIFAK